MWQKLNYEYSRDCPNMNFLPKYYFWVETYLILGKLDMILYGPCKHTKHRGFESCEIFEFVRGQLKKEKKIIFICAQSKIGEIHAFHPRRRIRLENGCNYLSIHTTTTDDGLGLCAEPTPL